MKTLCEEQARRDLTALCRRMYERGWVANHDGNASIRLDEGRILCTPTALSKGEIAPELLLVVDLQGQVLSGTRKTFSELSLHLAAYRAREDVRAVLHAHPPTASGFAVAGLSLDPPFMPEAVVSLGASIPLSEFVLPYGEAGAAPLAPHLDDGDAFLLASHGVLTLGPDAWTAFYRLELVEHLARIALVARQLGGPVPLSDAHVSELLERRKKAGLGAAGRAISPEGGGSPPMGRMVGTCSEPPASTPPSSLEQIIAAEVARVLGPSR